MEAVADAHVVSVHAYGRKGPYDWYAMDYVDGLDLLDIKHQLSRPMDGISIVPALEGFMQERAEPMGFLFRTKRSWMTHQYKLIS